MVRHLYPSPLGIGRPLLVGILNITADSFSDGGRFLAAEDAVAHARRLWSEGADIVELGPAASHPGAQQVSAAEEIRRLTVVIDRLAAEGVPVSFSGAVCAGSNPAGGTRRAGSVNEPLTWADADMRERESVSLTPALCRCVSRFATHLRHTQQARRPPPAPRGGGFLL
ncbi:hypothetical protein GCM10010397_44210 [Streptomyces spinoverrucosus]|nr:hypothetical protein GCM10010397_44210 [Streptomyces spinoverrucosus]